MPNHRKRAILLGIFFLISYAGVIIGPAIYSPLLEAPDYLRVLYQKRVELIAGVLVELLNDAAVVGIAVTFFPLLRRYGESMALGYLGFRFIEVVTLVVGKISVLSLVGVSREYIKAGAPGASSFTGLGILALAERHWASELTMIFFVLGALVFYTLLYRSELVPRFISIWGFGALASLVAGNLAAPPLVGTEFQPVMILFLPIILNELFLAVWLLAKGFNPRAVGGERSVEV